MTAVSCRFTLDPRPSSCSLHSTDKAFPTPIQGPRLADVFRVQVISNHDVRSPLLTLGSTTFSHVRHENIWIVAVTKTNANSALIFEFLYRLIGLGKSYFGKFDEESIKNNFVLVYELLDGKFSPGPCARFPTVSVHKRG